MPRRDHDDLDDADDVGGDYREDFPPARPRKSANAGLILGLVVGGGVLLVLLMCAGAIALFAWRAAPVPVANNAPELGPAEMVAEGRPDRANMTAARPDARKGQPPENRANEKKTDAAPKLLSRADFEAAVLQKTKKQIIDAVGRPDDTTDNVPRPVAKNVSSLLVEYWYFHDRVLHADTGKPYPVARVWMDYEKAYRIDYP
jgi:hypothetical protein